MDCIATHTILNKLQTTVFLFLISMTVLNNIILLLTQSRLSITQASSSFNRLDTFTPTHATPTFITEALCLVTQVLLLLTTVSVD